jgi:hypothetical protein
MARTEGSFTEYVALPEEQIHEIHAAFFVGCHYDDVCPEV